MSEQKSLAVFGSSSSEVFDYIFGDNPNYYPFWASGWSARGLRKLKQSEADFLPYKPFLDSLEKDANIFLHFGNTDIDFNLPYKIHHTNFYNIPEFLEEMLDGLVTLFLYLKSKNFHNIYAVFTAPPVQLQNIMYFEYPTLPSSARGRLLLDFAQRISKIIPTINCLHSIIVNRNNPICDKKFMREHDDHHVNYIKTQEIIYHHIDNVDGMLSIREPLHTTLYEHINYGPDDVLRTGKPRPRTCR